MNTKMNLIRLGSVSKVTMGSLGPGSEGFAHRIEVVKNLSADWWIPA